MYMRGFGLLAHYFPAEDAQAMTDTPRAPLSSFCYCIAIFLLGETLVRGDKQFDSIALACVAAAILIVALPLLLPQQSVNRRLLDGLIAVGVVVGFCRLPLIDLFFQYPASRQLLMPFVVLAAIAAVLAVLILFRLPRSMVGGAFVLLLLAFSLMGKFYLDLSASPHNDVYVVQELGCQALGDHRNPLGITFPDIYGPRAGFYPPGSVVNGQVQCGYFYPPLSLLMDLPGYLAGDLRYSHLAAVLIAAALLGYSQRHFAPAIWLLFTPRLLFILENSWIETYALLFLAIAVWCHERKRDWLVPVAVGLLLVTKQYLLLTIPAIALLMPQPSQWRTAGRFALIAVIAGSVVTLPFILWSPSAFLHSTTSLYTNLLRPDSISFLPIISRLLGTRLTLLCPLLAALPPSILILLRAPRSASGFAAAVALICLCVFAFSTQAFINYYFYATGALCVAIAAERGFAPDPVSATP
jgi:hypothetical protein